MSNLRQNKTDEEWTDLEARINKVLAKETVNSPKHYNTYDLEVIDMMIKIWGIDTIKLFCQINAFKYRMRLGHKNNISEDLAKEQWYLNKYKELCNEDKHCT